MQEKISLENLLIEVFPDRESGYAYEDLNNVTKAYIEKALLEFGQQLLKLASKNAIISHMSSMNGKPECALFAVNEQSILDTILLCKKK